MRIWHADISANQSGSSMLITKLFEILHVFFFVVNHKTFIIRHLVSHYEVWVFGKYEFKRIHIKWRCHKHYWRLGLGVAEAPGLMAAVNLFIRLISFLKNCLICIHCKWFLKPNSTIHCFQGVNIFKNIWPNCKRNINHF